MKGIRLRFLPPVVAPALLAAALAACKPAFAGAETQQQPPPAARSEARPEPVAVPEEILAVGAQIYEESCAQCHLDGSGSDTALRLKDAAILSDPAALARVIHAGRQSVRKTPEGETVSVMPAFAYLSDAELAGLMTWLRAEFGGNPSGLVTAEEAARLREQAVP